MEKTINKIKKTSQKITKKIMTGLKGDLKAMKTEYQYLNTINEIEYSDEYENHTELFENGINILKNRIVESNYKEFNEEERETLEDIFTIINKE